MTTQSAPKELRVPFEFRGGHFEMANARDREILVEGPRGTGKTRAILELINLLCQDERYPKLRVLIVRKTEKGLTLSCLATFQNKVLKGWNNQTHMSAIEGIRFYGGSKNEPSQYIYNKTGSSIFVGGMDDPAKVLSTEYDLVFANEATELTLEDWEHLRSCLRAGTLKHQRIIGDCNPSFDRHWLLQRCIDGKIRRIITTHKDNPEYFNADGTPTEAGVDYVEENLAGLSGAQYERFYLGRWTGMENAIYTLSRDLHIQECHVLPHEWGMGAIGVDYGDVHPKAAAAVQIGPTGRWWIRECHVTDDDTELEAAVRGMMQRFKITRIRVDPNQAYLGHKLGGKVAKRGPGTRKQRIDMMETLFNSSPPTLVLVKDGHGNEQLWNELNLYRWEKRESSTMEELIPVRIAEDRVAATEYAVEELMEAQGQRPMPASAKVLNSSQRSTPRLYSGV